MLKLTPMRLRGNDKRQQTLLLREHFLNRNDSLVGAGMTKNQQILFKIKKSHVIVGIFNKR